MARRAVPPGLLTPPLPGPVVAYPERHSVTGRPLDRGAARPARVEKTPTGWRVPLFRCPTFDAVILPQQCDRNRVSATSVVEGVNKSTARWLTNEGIGFASSVSRYECCLACPGVLVLSARRVERTERVTEEVARVVAEQLQRTAPPERKSRSTSIRYTRARKPDPRRGKGDRQRPTWIPSSALGRPSVIAKQMATLGIAPHRVGNRHGQFYLPREVQTWRVAVSTATREREP